MAIWQLDYVGGKAIYLQWKYTLFLDFVPISMKLHRACFHKTWSLMVVDVKIVALKAQYA